MRRVSIITFIILLGVALLSCSDSGSGDSGGNGGGAPVVNATYPNMRSALDNLGGSIEGYQLFYNRNENYYWFAERIAIPNIYNEFSDNITYLPILTGNSNAITSSINSAGNLVVEEKEYDADGNVIGVVPVENIVAVEVKDLSGQTLTANPTFKNQAITFPAGSVVYIIRTDNANRIDSSPFALTNQDMLLLFNKIGAEAIISSWDTTIVPDIIAP